MACRIDAFELEIDYDQWLLRRARRVYRPRDRAEMVPLTPDEVVDGIRQEHIHLGSVETLERLCRFGPWF